MSSRIKHGLDAGEEEDFEEFIHGELDGDVPDEPDEFIPDLGELRSVELLRCQIVGLRHHPAVERHWEDLRVGDALSLRPEPENPHDPVTVAIYWQGRKLGYLPRERNASIFALLKQGVMLDAALAWKGSRKRARRRLEISILMDAVVRGSEPVVECPVCGSADVVAIVYGRPDRALQRDADLGRIELGGCLVTGSAPDVRCASCRHAWRRGR